MTEQQDRNSRMDRNELKLPSVTDVVTPADFTESSTVKCNGSSVSECETSGVNDSALSLQDGASASENSQFLQPPSKVLTSDLALQSCVLDAGGFVCDALPICTQIPTSTQLSASPCTTRSLYVHGTSSSASECEHSLETAKVNHQQLTGDDLCASVVLACLFCRAEEFVSAAADGLQWCLSFLCSELCAKLCCCDTASLETVLEVFPSCNPANCLDSQCCLCGEWSVCELCLHATECLELGMEVSQLLFH